jgi:hypothetical protein
MWLAGGYSSGNTPVIAYSYDGINWTQSTSGSSIFQNACYALAWTGRLWLAGGDGNGGIPPIAYSYDGIVWNSASSSLGLSTDIRTIASSGTINIAGGQTSVCCSYDGINWFNSNWTAGPGGSLSCYTIAYNGTIWVLGCGYCIRYSYDGINWTLSSSGSTLMGFVCKAVAWNGRVWVAGGQSSNGVGSLAYSSDGINWTASSSANAIFTTDVYSIGWNGTWIASAYDGAIALIGYSTDGITWTTSGTSTSYSLAYAITARRVLPYYGTTIGGPAGAIKLSEYGTGTSDVSAYTLAVTFARPFPVTPSITATVTDGSASWASIGSASATAFTAYTWNASGGVSVPLNWQAIL